MVVSSGRCQYANSILSLDIGNDPFIDLMLERIKGDPVAYKPSFGDTLHDKRQKNIHNIILAIHT